MTTLGGLKIKSAGYFTTVNTKFSTYRNLQNGLDDKTCRNISVNNLYMTGSLIGTGSLNLLAPTINIGITGTNLISIGGTGTTINLSGNIISAGLQALITSVGFTGGTQSFVIPDTVDRIEIEAWGPGGGGAGSGTDNFSFQVGGGGGGAGGYVRAIADVTPGESLTITVGLAGSGGSNNQNGTTGTSNTTVVGSFGTITAAAGGGGQNTDLGNIGGNGGAASAVGSYIFTFASPGASGEFGQKGNNLTGASFSFFIEGANGGKPTMGGDSVNQAAEDPINTAPTPGGGGRGGSMPVLFHTIPDGTKGANGLVILTYFV